MTRCVLIWKGWWVVLMYLRSELRIFSFSILKYVYLWKIFLFYFIFLFFQVQRFSCYAMLFEMGSRSQAAAIISVHKIAKYTKKKRRNGFASTSSALMVRSWWYSVEEKRGEGEREREDTRKIFKQKSERLQAVRFIVVLACVRVAVFKVETIF